MIKFSVIIPIYNVEKYLKKCVDSVLEQSYKNIEIILVDDGSSDDCPMLCDEYARMYDRVRVVHKKNGGLSDARNAGMELATGDYLLFVDSDDYVEIDTCEKFSHFAHKGYDILIGDALVNNEKCNLSHIKNATVLSGKEYLLMAYKEGRAPMAAWLNVYRRMFLVENGLKFKYGILHEDEEFTPRCFLTANSTVCTGIVFYHYIIRENSITTKTDKRKNITDFYDTCLELEANYRLVEDESLRDALLNSLVTKYLSIYSDGSLCNYGTKYQHKAFCLRNAKSLRNKIKALSFCVNPKQYCNLVLLRNRIYDAWRKLCQTLFLK